MAERKLKVTKKLVNRLHCFHDFLTKEKGLLLYLNNKDLNGTFNSNGLDVSIERIISEKKKYVKLKIKQNQISQDKLINSFWTISRLDPVLFSRLFKSKGFLKEVTESMIVVDWLLNNYDKKIKATFYILGDGTTPRTGYLCTKVFPAAKVVSIDPNFKEEWVGEKENIKVIKDLAEKVEIIPGEDFTVFISVHGHAPLKNCVNLFQEKHQKPLIVLSIPCCLLDQQILEMAPTETFKLPLFNTTKPNSIMYVYKFT